MRGALHHTEILALHPVEFRFEREFRHANDTVHGGANFVAHVCEKFALGAAGGFGGLLRLKKLSLYPALLSDVL